MRTKFAGLLRRLLHRLDDRAESPLPTAAVSPPLTSTPASVMTPSRVANPNEIELPLAPIIAGLPIDLRTKLMVVPAAGMTICLPIEIMMSQLSFGAVKISFGELRQMAPNIFANSGGEHDNRPVSLPLDEILSRLNPALLARRPSQKIEVAEEIVGPFGQHGRGVTFTTQPLKPAPPPPPPPPRVPPPVVSGEKPETNIPIAFMATPSLQRTVSPPPPVPPVRPVTSVAPAKPAATNPAVSAAPVLVPASAAPTTEPVQPTIFAGLWDLAENWPEELKDEISRSALANVSIPLASALVEAGLKRGRITMPWKQLRLLAKPSSAVSVNDHLELDLPLKVIAPMFFAAQKKSTSSRKTVKVSADIPTLFFGFPQAAPEPTTSAPQLVEKKTAEMVSSVRGDEGEAPKTESGTVAPPAAPQPDFTIRQDPPTDVVQRAMALPGVAGVLVTLPDGLRVASQVAMEFNADTLAAFIPQIFERLNQATRELRMGALNDVNFTVGQVTWKIFRVNAVYFAVFGRAGVSLPTAQLAALAVELDRKK
ncbi:MAG: roadblock/LC7 domain-containing protein [Verrucomicrobiota bacterium]